MDAVELEPIAQSLTVTSARLLIRGYVVEYLAYFFHSVQITKLLRGKKKGNSLEDISWFGGKEKVVWVCECCFLVSQSLPDRLSLLGPYRIQFWCLSSSMQFITLFRRKQLICQNFSIVE